MRGAFCIFAALCYDELMTTVSLEKARDDLPALVKRALAGEEIVISEGAAAVKLAPVPAPQVETDDPGLSYRGFGALKSQLVIGPEFFEPLSDEECGLGNESDAE